MKRSYQVRAGKRTIVREYNYIPFRYILAVGITVLEILGILAMVVLCCYYIPYFYIAALLTEVFCVIRIVSSDDNPDYKVPWLLFVLILPIAGFMFYFLFYSRKLKPRFVRRLSELSREHYEPEGEEALLLRLECEDPHAAAQAKMLCKSAGATLFDGGRQTYFPSGEQMWAAMLADLRRAERFIFMEYFIIEEGVFWGSILEVLKEKAAKGVTVRVLYDDIGCMSTLPGDYHKRLRAFGIEAAPFSRLRGQADNEFNNRNHRKICVIDGRIGYTGGVNIADEYVNRRVRFGHWKDTAIRLEGAAVYELTRIFLTDYGINEKTLPSVPKDAYPALPAASGSGYAIPFGDGPSPLYPRRVAKGVIQNMLGAATRYVYMTTPYLIMDNDLCQSIENAALRGVDVRITVPHVPDKRMVFGMTRSCYHRLLRAGVRIFEYTPGFIHAKSYLADGKIAMIGTVNLDYRSLVHHFENGVWLYGGEAIAALKRDMEDTMALSAEVSTDGVRAGLLTRFFRSLVRIFAPML